MSDIDEKLLLEAMEDLVRLAKKGKRYDEMLKTHAEKIKDINTKAINQKTRDQETIRKMYHEIIELKSTHQDYEARKCEGCNGAGGDSWVDEYGNGDCWVCGQCGGTGTEFVKKEVK